MDPLIRFENVSRKYLEHNKLTVGIQDINFNTYAHQILSILGPSGCGKTTILRLICNLIKPDSGNIFYKDTDISYARFNGLIGLVPQESTLLPNRTVAGNIRLPLEIKNRVDNEVIMSLINLVGLNGFENFYPHQLSGGMKQRVSLARALIYEPDVLLMDEPFASLDEIVRENLNLELIRIQRRLEQTIVFVTHNIEEATFISDRIIVMSSRPGKIIGEIEVDLPKNRSKEIRYSEQFLSIVRNIRNLLEQNYA